jgi:hypothetical protein
MTFLSFSVSFWAAGRPLSTQIFEQTGAEALSFHQDSGMIAACNRLRRSIVSSAAR